LRRRRVSTPVPGAYPHIRLVQAGAVLAVTAILISVLGVDSWTPNWAKNLPPLTETIFKSITDFGTSGWLLVPTGVFGLLLLFANWSRVQRGVAAAWVEVGELVGFFFFNLAAAGMVTNVIKWTLGRSRPLRFEKDGILTFQPFSIAHDHVSFPSGHATTAAATFVACAYIFRGRPVLVAVIGFCAAAIAVSRVAVGAHFPSDVFAGIFVGAAFTVLYAHALGRSGVAFQCQPDCTLKPKTIALRTMFGTAGLGAMLTGLRTALAGGKTR
jgi:undecaprenyl-diphosphatase